MERRKRSSAKRHLDFFGHKMYYVNEMTSQFVGGDGHSPVVAGSRYCFLPGGELAASQITKETILTLLCQISFDRIDVQIYRT